MDDKYIVDAFRKINADEEEMFGQVKRRIDAGTPGTGKRKGLLRTAAIGTAAAAALGIIVYSVPSLNSFAGDTIKSILGYFITDGEHEVKMDIEYIDINNTEESRTEKKYTSLDEIEEMLGVDLLQSTEEYTDTEGTIFYDPTVIGDQIYGAGIINSHYSIGDLKNARFETDEDDLSVVPSAWFDTGDKYDSTLACQIVIAGKRPDDEVLSEYENGEYDWEIPKNSKLIEYTPANVNTQAVIYEIQMDGGSFDSLSHQVAGEADVTVAHLTYEGIEYIYYARISVDTMKEFLDTLYAEPGKYEVTEPADLTESI